MTTGFCSLVRVGLIGGEKSLMSEAILPVMSVVLIMPDTFETIRQTAKHLFC